MMNDKTIASVMICPDGTVLQSFHRHDYKTHVDALTGEEYMIDGGLDYLRTNLNKIGAKYITVTMADPHEQRRSWFSWGTYGKNGDQPLTWKKLCDMETEHIEAILRTQTHISEHLVELFNAELEYRNDKN